MSSNWKNCGNQMPPMDKASSKERGNKRSKDILIVSPDHVFEGHDAFVDVFVGYYCYNHKALFLMTKFGVKSIPYAKINNVFWCNVPEYNGVIKTIIKKIKREQNE